MTTTPSSFIHRPSWVARLTPRRLATCLASVLLGAGLAFGGTPLTAHAWDPTVWDRVAACESTGRWSINNGNGFYGGLQFSYSTWLAFGGGAFAPRADLATKAEQIAIARRTLYAQGPGAWPHCSIVAGLTRTNGGADPKAMPLQPAAPAPAKYGSVQGEVRQQIPGATRWTAPVVKAGTATTQTMPTATPTPTPAASTPAVSADSASTSNQTSAQPSATVSGTASATPQAVAATQPPQTMGTSQATQTQASSQPSPSTAGAMLTDASSEHSLGRLAAQQAVIGVQLAHPVGTTA